MTKILLGFDIEKGKAVWRYYERDEENSYLRLVEETVFLDDALSPTDYQPLTYLPTTTSEMDIFVEQLTYRVNFGDRAKWYAEYYRT